MKLLVYIFVFFCFFPYLDFLKIGTDTQPNAIMVGVVILFTMNNKKINGPLIALWFLFLLSILFAFDSQLQTFVTIKTVLNYLSPALVAFTAYNVFINTSYRIGYRFFLFVVISYLAVGLVQNLIFPNFMSPFLNEVRGVHLGGRGVTSMTNEPSFYGIHCLFLSIIALLNFDKKKNYILQPLLLFQLFFLAKTSTAIGLLMVSFFVFGMVQVFQRKIKYILLFGVVIAAGIISYNNIMKAFEDTRLGDLAHKFIEDPLMLTQVDQSASVRLTATFAPFIAIKENYFMPLGFGRYNSFVSDLYYQQKYRKLIIPYTLRYRDKIGGGVNVILFHFGFLGLLFPLAVYRSFRYKIDQSKYLLSLILFILLLTTIQLMNAMIGFIIGYVLYATRNEKIEAESQSEITPVL